MHIDDKIKIQRIDGNTVDINGQRFSTEEALQYLRDLAQEFGQGLYTQEYIENVQQENQESNVDAFANGYDEGFENGVESVNENSDNNKYCCSKCDIELTPEHIERLSNIDKPRLNEFDHCKLIFDISDYNESCKK